MHRARAGAPATDRRGEPHGQAAARTRCLRSRGSAAHRESRRASRAVGACCATRAEGAPRGHRVTAGLAASQPRRFCISQGAL
eukprot:11278272-Prorocentrum_lima.AAC.1